MCILPTVARYGHAADFFSLHVRTKTWSTCARQLSRFFKNRYATLGACRVSAINNATHVRPIHWCRYYMPLVRLATRAISDWPHVAVAYSRGADTACVGQSACSPGTLRPVTRGRYRPEWGWLGDVIYWRPADPGHRVVTLLPVLNLRRRPPRLDDEVVIWVHLRVVDVISVST